MFQNYFSVAFRNLIKNKLYSAINIVGLAVGLMSCVLIMLFVRDELSFDTFWKNTDTTYRLNSTFQMPGRDPFVTVLAPGPAKAALESYYADDIEAVTRFRGQRPVIRNGEAIFTEDVTWTDPAVLDVFDFEVVRGDLHASMNDNASLALSESMAEKHFGQEDPIGKILTLSFYEVERDYRIAAVYRDLPHNTVLDLPALAMIDEKDFENFPWEFASWTSVNTSIFFKLKDGVSIDRINSRLKDFTDKSVQVPGGLPPGANASDFLLLNTMQLPDIQLNAEGGGEMKPTGSMMTVMIFIAIAGLILLIACINFMNLATAKSTQRAREVALRKVLGAHRGQLILQFLGESVLIALIGLFLGLALVELALPAFNNFLSRELDFIYGDGMTLAILLGLVCTVGFVGGAYPALVLSGFLPARVLRANKSAETSSSIMFRNALVVLQFAISIALIVSAAVVYGQMVYATSMDPGFKKDNMLVVRGLQQEGANDKREAFKQEILNLSGVAKATLSSDRPSSGNNSNTSVTIPGTDSGDILLGRYDVDYDFFDTYDVKLVAGRFYSRDYATDGVPSGDGLEDGAIAEGSIVINETAVGRLGFVSAENAVGKVVRLGIGDGKSADLQIIGVTRPIHFQSLREMLRPEMYIMAGFNLQNLTVSFEGDPTALMSQVEEIWKQMIPAVPFAYEFVDEAMAEEFEQEEALASMLATFSMLAVAIACLGLYGLASFTAERRTKEIGIRKVMGASVLDIVKLLLWQFSKPVLIANLIAWPLAVWGMLSWLENFPYRLEIWIMAPLCLIAGIIALSIAWLTVGGNAAKVARSNPITALRYE